MSAELLQSMRSITMSTTHFEKTVQTDSNTVFVKLLDKKK